MFLQYVPSVTRGQCQKPKKEFDELLRRMAHIKAEEESPNEETDKKEEKEE